MSLPEMQNYVLGFVFDKEKKHVALIRKNRPANQAGFLNGIGGKMEYGEKAMDAMLREAYEETGVALLEDELMLFSSFGGDWGTVYCFKGFIDHEVLKSMHCDETEQIEIHAVSELDKELTFDNVKHLIDKAINPWFF